VLTPLRLHGRGSFAMCDRALGAGVHLSRDLVAGAARIVAGVRVALARLDVGRYLLGGETLDLAALWLAGLGVAVSVVAIGVRAGADGEDDPCGGGARRDDSPTDLASVRHPFSIFSRRGAISYPRGYRVRRHPMAALYDGEEACVKGAEGLAYLLPHPDVPAVGRHFASAANL